MQKYTLYIITGLLALVSCARESYETGEGDMSYLHADYTDITIKNGAVASALTDENVSLIMPADVKYADATVQDTMIRRLLYYNMPSATETITLYKVTPVAVCSPIPLSKVMTTLTDPVKLTSIWISPNQCYLNMHLGIMVGSSSESAAVQRLTISCDSIKKDIPPTGALGGTSSTFLTLRHDQAGFEQYYTQYVYVSIPMDSITTDTLNVTVNTYSGIETRQFIK